MQSTSYRRAPTSQPNAPLAEHTRQPAAAISG